MKYYQLIILIFCSFISCKQEITNQTTAKLQQLIDQPIEYANGFTIRSNNIYTEVTITSPWPDSKETFTYILYDKGTQKPIIDKKVKYIPIPIEKLVVTSTTDIPMLEYLTVEDKLIGFPDTKYISSQKTRQRINNGKVIELGNNGQLNTEITLELAPELIIGFSASGNTKTYDLIEKTGIPVVINGSWMEQHPLGRAEWIKFIGTFFNKRKEANAIFSDIKSRYNNAVKIAKNETLIPTLISGNVYKDIWHVPGGNSYVAKIFKDANINYLWRDTKKTGSIPLNFESVLEKGQQATLWIGAGTAKSLDELTKQNNRYTLFEAFKNKTVYSSSLKTGTTGGQLYYELGPMRPDLILKDIIQIAYPKLLKEYEPYFFEKLN